MSQKQVSRVEFTKARSEGKTIKEMAQEFNISENSCKKIIAQLGLPKRGVKPGFVLIDDVEKNEPQNESMDTMSFQKNTEEILA